MIETAMKDTEDLSPGEKKQLNDLISKLKKGDQLSEENQSQLALILQKLGQKTFAAARPLLENVLSEANKKQFGF
jgi:hypothetical protein